MIYVIVSITNNTVINVIKSEEDKQPDLSAMHYDWQIVSVEDAKAPEGLTFGWTMKKLGEFEPPSLDALREQTGTFLKGLFAQIKEDHPDLKDSILDDALSKVQNAKTAEDIVKVTITTKLKPLEVPTEKPPEDLVNDNINTPTENVA